MRHEAARWRFSYGWLRGEDYWGDPVSDNFARLDALLHPWVKQMFATVPPDANTIGESYVLGANAEGDWTGKDNQLAVYTEFGWLFCEPLTKGIRVGSEAPAGWFFWNGTEWTTEANVDPNPPPLQGTRYDVVLWCGFEAEPTETVGGIPLPEDMTLPNGGPDCVGRCRVPPASPVNIAVFRNFVDQIGTISFVPGSVNATFTFVGDKPFARGQTISFQMPSTLPDGFRDYGATLRLILNNGG